MVKSSHWCVNSEELNSGQGLNIFFCPILMTVREVLKKVSYGKAVKKSLAKWYTWNKHVYLLLYLKNKLKPVDHQGILVNQRLLAFAHFCIGTSAKMFQTFLVVVDCSDLFLFKVDFGNPFTY